MSSFSHSSELSSALRSMEYKLKQLWKIVQYSHPLLAGLVDSETISSAGLDFIEKSIIEMEYIKEKLGVPLCISLFRKGSNFYFHLSAGDANVWTTMCSPKNNTGMRDMSTKMAATSLEETKIEKENELSELTKSSFQSEKWSLTIFSTIKLAFEHFSYKIRYSKEPYVLPRHSTESESNFDIARGDILCAKRYTKHVKDLLLTSYYHFGVYVGSCQTADGHHFIDAVIHLQKNSESKNSFITMTSLVGNKEGEGFVHHDPGLVHPPLLFKVIYKDRKQSQRNETAKTAEEIYRNVDHYAKKYSLLSNNCEHFVNVCAFGTPYCEQHARFIMTAIPCVLERSPLIARALQCILPLFAELTESCLSVMKHMPYIGESIAIIMLLLECVVRIIWDIYLLKESGCLTRSKIIYIMKKRILPIAPELLSAVVFLLLTLCGLTGPVGIALGISGVVLLVVLRLTTRPRIERWIEEHEFARREDFLQWYPSEVARLVMKTAEDDEPDDDVLSQFESKNLSGEFITSLIQKQRRGDGDGSFETVLSFLGPEKLQILQQNLKKIFGHLSLEDVKGSVTVTYEGKSLTVEPSVADSITVRQLLDMARLNWGVDYAKGRWQLTAKDNESGNSTVIASFSIKNSIEKEINTIPDTSMELELKYTDSEGCSVM